jgi:hypothetical protein
MECRAWNVATAALCRLIRRRRSGGGDESLNREPVAHRGQNRGISILARLHQLRFRNFGPPTIRYDCAIGLQLRAQGSVVVIGRSHGGEGPVELLIAQISHERAVHVLFFRIYVPRLLDGSRIYLAGEQVLAQRYVGSREE